MPNVTPSPTRAVPKLDSKRKTKVQALAQLMDVPTSVVVQIAIDRLHQSQTTKERSTNGK